MALAGLIELALLPAALLAALAYWVRYCLRDDPGRAGALVKTAATGCLAAALWLQVAAGPAGLWPVALGLTLGAAGDWFLARRGEMAFLAGMAAFGAGHLAYAGGLVAQSSALGSDGWSAAEIAAAAALVALLVSTEAWLAPRTGALRGPVRAYVGLIGLMALALLAVPGGPGRAALAAGGALFVLSDLLLALRLFVVRRPGLQDALSLLLWPAYWGGQALIALGAVAFWARPGG